MLDIIDVVAGFTRPQSIVEKLSIETMTEGNFWTFMLAWAVIAFLLDLVGLLN